MILLYCLNIYYLKITHYNIIHSNLYSFLHAAAAAAKSLQLCPTLCDPIHCSPPGSSVHGDSPGKNTGVGCDDLLQGIFPTQGLDPGLLHCRQILYHLSHQESPTMIHRINSVQFSHSVVSDSLRPHESQHARTPCPSPTPGVHSDLHPLSW